MIYNILKYDKNIELKEYFLQLETDNSTLYIYNDGLDALSGLIIKNLLTIY